MCPPFFLERYSMDIENCVKYFGPNTPTALTQEECSYMVNQEGSKFTKPGWFSKASGKTKSNRPIDFNIWKGFYRDEQARKKLREQKAQPAPVPVAPVAPVAPVPVAPVPVAPVAAPAPVKQMLPKEKSSFYEDFKNGKNWVQCQGQPGCVPYSQLYVDDFSGERTCNLAVVNNGRTNVVYDGTNGTVMTLEKKCEKKRGPVYLRGGKRTRRSRKSKRKTR